MTRTGQIQTIFCSLVVSLMMLMFAASGYEKAKRVATEAPVSATVANVWSTRTKGGGQVFFAHLIFDRKLSDGEVVHCDVPKVSLGLQPAKAGGSITIYPRATSCWEPDVLCENCDSPYSNMPVRAILLVASISGLIFLFVAWRLLRDIRREGNRQF